MGAVKRRLVVIQTAHRSGGAGAQGLLGVCETLDRRLISGDTLAEARGAQSRRVLTDRCPLMGAKSHVAQVRLGSAARFCCDANVRLWPLADMR